MISNSLTENEERDIPLQNSLTKDHFWNACLGYF